MKKLVFLLILISAVSFAQKGERGEKIKAYKTAFITDALDLTVYEAEKFWPIYNEHEDQMQALRRKERMEIFQTVRGDLDALSEEEANELIEKVITLKSQEVNFEKELINNLKGIIPAKKILKLKKAEEEFKRMLLEKFRGRGRKP